MESATILTPLAPAYTVFCFLSEPNIPEGPEYEKKSALYQCTGRNFTIIAFSDFKIFVFVRTNNDFAEFKARLFHRKQVPLLLILCDKGAGLVVVFFFLILLIRILDIALRLIASANSHDLEEHVYTHRHAINIAFMRG